MFLIQILDRLQMTIFFYTVVLLIQLINTMQLIYLNVFKLKYISYNFLSKIKYYIFKDVLVIYF